jgi:uncharacterized protein (TIGR03435 family)
MQRPVLNRTGIIGNFDFVIEYAADESQADTAPHLARVIQDQVGLKLERQPGSMRVLVIDGARKPSEN